LLITSSITRSVLGGVSRPKLFFPLSAAEFTSLAVILLAIHMLDRTELVEGFLDAALIAF
jgi:hypothetical protein